MKSIIDLIYYSDYFRTTDNSSLSDEYMSAVDRVVKPKNSFLPASPSAPSFLKSIRTRK